MTLSLCSLRDRLEQVVSRCGRNPDSIRIVAVSKGHAPAVLRQVFTEGQTVFGENYLQEALPKMAALAELPIEWHFIGHLQSNKAAAVAREFSWIHSIASLPMAERISAAANVAGRKLSVLLQVNLGGAPAQHGVSPAALLTLVDTLLEATLPHLEYRGLMTIAPRDNAAASFARLRRLGEEVRNRFGLPTFTELSMGMSDDWETAVSEGATLLRLGRVLLGPRAR